VAAGFTPGAEHATIAWICGRRKVSRVWSSCGKALESLQAEEGHMQTSLIIESNGSGKDKLDQLLKDGWTVSTITANHGKSYNDFLIILEK
jgi:hypothetical protein